MSRTCMTRDGSSLVLREAPNRRKLAAVWPLGQAIAAAADLRFVDHDLRDVGSLMVTLRRYRDPDDDGYAPTPGARRRYFDDNAWIGLVFSQLYLQTEDARFLRQARRTLRFVRRGEDPEGGVRWVEGRRSRNSCATAPAAQLALRIHLLDGEPGALAFAIRCLDWLDATLLRSDRLYADRIDGRGRIGSAVWSYNQGAALGAHLLRWRATDDDRSLTRATATARATIRHLSASDRLWRHPPVFNAIALRNLLALDAVVPLDGFGEMVDTYLDRAWEEARDPETGLFTAGGIGASDGGPAIDHAGLVQLFALSGWPRAARDLIC
jgi:hypothetical protein